MKRILALLFVPLTLFLIWYGYMSYKAYVNSEADTQGFFICNKEKTICELSQHIHANIEMVSCGKEVYFPKEQGKTDKQHTHKEQNLIHWHARERVDPTTKEPLDRIPRELRSFFVQMDYKISEKCDEHKAIFTLFVNGIEEKAGLDYIWKDKDKLKVIVN